LSKITVDLRDRKQLYEQIIDNVKERILVGDLKPDEKLPSVRALAKELGINPNTIQKAYTELERNGVIVTLQGRGSIVSANSDVLKTESMNKLTEKMTMLAGEMKLIGVTETEFLRSAEEGWKRSGKENNHD